LQTEVILCPNCREEVPKTLYCLNCGYPLYKEELTKSEPEEKEDVVVEVAPEPFAIEPLLEAAAEGASIEEDEPGVTPAVTEDVYVEAAPEFEPAFEAVEQIETVDVPQFEVVEECGEPPAEEETPAEGEVVEAFDVVEIVEEIESLEPEGPDVVEVVEKVAVVSEDVAEEAVVEVVEPAAVFEPDPVIREVMENFAKNISMKIRLVSLLQDGEVKVETFERLFDSYVARGELLMNSRNETLERVRFDQDSREKALNEARIGLEELGIRKAIGDVSEEEYSAKSPGFEWDIGQYKDDVARKKAEIAYLGDLAHVMSAEEIDELRVQGEKSYETIDGLADSGVVGAETASRIKVTLEEALSCLKSSC